VSSRESERESPPSSHSVAAGTMSADRGGKVLPVEGEEGAGEQEWEREELRGEGGADEQQETEPARLAVEQEVGGQQGSGEEVQTQSSGTIHEQQAKPAKRGELQLEHPRGSKAALLLQGHNSRIEKSRIVKENTDELIDLVREQHALFSAHGAKSVNLEHTLRKLFPEGRGRGGQGAGAQPSDVLL
jgi:hypothetical protein